MAEKKFKKKSKSSTVNLKKVRYKKKAVLHYVTGEYD